MDGDADGVPAFLDPDDADPEVTMPVATAPADVRGVVLVGEGCTLFSESGRYDPLFLLAMLTSVAGLVRRRQR